MFMCNKFDVESNKIFLSKATICNVYLILSHIFLTIMALNYLGIFSVKFNLQLIRLINQHIM